MELYQLIINQAANALDEDVGSGDISGALIDAETRLETELLLREDAVLCGCQWFDEVLRQCDERIKIHWLAGDGDSVAANSVGQGLSAFSQRVVDTLAADLLEDQAAENRRDEERYDPQDDPAHRVAEHLGHARARGQLGAAMDRLRA